MIMLLFILLLQLCSLQLCKAWRDEQRTDNYNVQSDTSHPVFRETRGKIDVQINRVVLALVEKKNEMFRELAKLEEEFIQEQKQKRIDLTKLKELKEKADTISHNYIPELQHRILNDLEQGIDKLRLDIEQTKNPDYQIEVKWAMNIPDLLNQIDTSKIEYHYATNGNIPNFVKLLLFILLLQLSCLQLLNNVEASYVRYEGRAEAHSHPAFQKTRGKITALINRTTLTLNQNPDEMFRELAILEKDFIQEQKQKQIDLSML
ncbi:hypothetical protein LOD99_11804 [Oopsacas minuta]|uniref:Uncharacterized protein n=1 Tax=Oopsacas minuta TaxID=111878 RepID=A0AAV7JKQ9_9METZ|nr:hypothetical protein LOD99_11804 [Oopsacas minuta]